MKGKSGKWEDGRRGSEGLVAVSLFVPFGI